MGQGVSREQIDRAKSINIEDYILTHEPQNIKRIGRSLYLKDHDSLEISNSLWNWHSQGIGGKNVVDYLIKVRGYDFIDAVQHLVGSEIAPTYTVTPKARPPTERKLADGRCPFKLPPRNADNNRVIEYLESRGIGKELIQDCIDRRLLYESAIWHNAVFVGRDERGKARFAALRGIMGDFKCDADGSDKRYGFCLPPNDRECKTAIIFESPIDALSHKMLFPQVDGYRLSLGGTALVSLTHFLETHSDVTDLIVCTDNDAAGNKAAAQIADLPGYRFTRELPPNHAKDWNEYLQLRKELNPLEDVRKPIIFRDKNYKEAFRIKDGESIKITVAYDGEELIRKCRWIDEAHLEVGTNTYHNDEFSERMAKVGNQYEPVPSGEPMIDIIAAKYGEPLKDAVIPMTEVAIKAAVGGDYTTELLKNHDGKYTYGALLRGKEGMAVCGVGSNNETLTSLHPYNARSFKRELSTEPPRKASIICGLEEAKAEAAAHNTANGRVARPKNRGEQEV